MNCEKVKESVLLYLYDELEGGARDAVEQHLDSCPTCSRLLRDERQFLRSLNEREVPSEALLAECRHDLMRGVYRRRAERGSHPAGGALAAAWYRLRQSLASLRPAWQPTAALALLVVGFYAGRVTHSTLATGLVTDGNPIQYSSVAPLAGPGDIQSIRLDRSRNNVEIVVEQVTRRTITGTPRDPRIRTLLISALGGYPNSGVRLDTLDVLSAGVEDPQVRQALRRAMVSDRNPGVRLRAFKALKPHKDDPQIRQALIEVLLHDDNPGMRVQAIDLLTERPDRNLVGLLQDLVGSEQNNYVRLRSRRVLYDLNASADRF